MTKFLMIRHATTDTVGQRLSGRKAGVNLNEEGKVQAQKLSQQLAGLPIAGIYCSPMERCLQTARPIAAACKLEPVKSEDFLEIDFGDWTDCSIEELQRDPLFQTFNTFRSSTRIPGGELMLEAQTRFVSGLHKLSKQHPRGTLAVVSHSDVIKAALAYFAGIPLDMFQRIEVSPASVSILEVYRDTARILLVNHTGEIKP